MQIIALFYPGKRQFIDLLSLLFYFSIGVSKFSFTFLNTRQKYTGTVNFDSFKSYFYFFLM